MSEYISAADIEAAGGRQKGIAGARMVGPSGTITVRKNIDSSAPRPHVAAPAVHQHFAIAHRAATRQPANRFLSRVNVFAMWPRRGFLGLFGRRPGFYRQTLAPRAMGPQLRGGPVNRARLTALKLMQSVPQPAQHRAEPAQTVVVLGMDDLPYQRRSVAHRAERGIRQAASLASGPT